MWRSEHLVEEEEQQSETAVEEEANSRPRSESWFSKFGKSVANTAKKIGKDIGDGTKKLGKQIGDGTKKVFAPKHAAAEEEAAADGEAAPAAVAADEGEGAKTNVAPVAKKHPKFPATGMRTATPYGEGVIVLLEEGRAVVHLDWCLADGHPARAYLAAELLKRPVPKFIQGAGKVMHKVGDAIAGDNGIFGKNTWAKVGDGMKKAGTAIKHTADKATHGVKEAFKKRSPSGGNQADLETALTESKEGDESAAVAEEGANPYAQAE